MDYIVEGARHMKNISNIVNDAVGEKCIIEFGLLGMNTIVQIDKQNGDYPILTNDVWRKVKAELVIINDYIEKAYDDSISWPDNIFSGMISEFIHINEEIEYEDN